MAQDKDYVDIKSNIAIGGSCTTFEMVCLSFICPEKDRVECYIWMHGFGFKFLQLFN